LLEKLSKFFIHHQNKGYMFIYSDAGRSLSKRPNQTNDCTVRAFALAFQIPYDQAYDYLKEQGRVCSKGFHLQKLLAKEPTIYGLNVKKIKIPFTAGSPRIKVDDFVKMYPKGTYIIRIAKHVACVKDGVVYDMSLGYGQKMVYVAFSVPEVLPIQEEYHIKTSGEKLKVQVL
jgi:hypothetical protein